MKNLLTVAGLLLASFSFAAPQVDSSEFYFSKGISEKKAGRLLVAADAFDKAISFNKSYAAAYIENAVTALEMRQLNRALENFTKANELQPNNPLVVKELTNLYYSYRQWDKAIALAKQCKSCNDADRIIGMSLYQKEEYPEAEKALMRAVAKDPKDAQTMYTLARTLLDMEEYDKAVPYYEKAIALDGSKFQWMNDLGLLYYTNYNYKMSVQSFEKAKLAGYPVNNDFNENLGYAYLYAGNYEKGEAMLVDIARKRTGNKDIIRDLAIVLHEQKQYDRSLVYCQQLLEANPKDGKALYQAGLNFIKKGQKDKGQQMCDKAIEMDPSLAKNRTKKEMPGGL